MNANSMDKNQLVIAAALVVILAGASGFWLGRRAERSGWRGLAGLPPSPPSAEIAGFAGMVLAGGNAVTVDDQPPGATAAIRMVTLARDGWVAVHEDDGGKPGRIPGATRYNAGTHENGTVELLWPSEEGRVYYAMLHADDGDRKFDRTKDLPITDALGNPIMMRFVTAANPAPQ